MADQSIPEHLIEKQNKTLLSWGNPRLTEYLLVWQLPDLCENGKT